MKRRNLLRLIPVFIVYVLIFRFLYLENGISIIMKVCIPVFLGLFIAIILNPLLVFLENKVKIKYRWLSILIIYIIFFGLIAMIILIATPSIIDSIAGFLKDIPKLIESGNNTIKELTEKYNLAVSDQFYNMLSQFISEGAQRITQLLTPMLNSAIGKVINLASAMWNFILATIISVYILLDKEVFENWFFKLSHSIFERKYADEIVYIGYELNKNVTRFINGKLLDSFIIGIIAYVVCNYIIKSQYSLVIAIIIGITNMIPYFGPFIGGIPVTIITLLYDPIKGLWMGLFILALQQFDGLLLGPKILGIQLSVKPIIIIASVIIGGGLFGPIGMFLGTPVAALLKTLIDGYMKIKFENKGINLPHQKS